MACFCGYITFFGVAVDHIHSEDSDELPQPNVSDKAAEHLLTF